MSQTRLLLTVLILLSAATFSVNVTSCMQINSSGSYVLQNDLFNGTVPANPNSVFSFVCVRISSSDVNLDCAGHHITGNGSVDIGVATDEEPTPLTNITIQNCDVSGYHIAFYGNNDHLSVWRNNTAHNTTLGGFFLTSLGNSNATNNSAFNNGQMGMFVYGSGNNYSDNFVCNNPQDGMRMTGFYSTANDTFFNNIICGNGRYGMSASLASGTLTVFSSGNHFYNNNLDMGMLANVSMQMSGDVFDNPSGSMKNFTVLSLSDADTSGGYTINWSAMPAPLPAGYQTVGGRFLNISQATSGESIDQLTWSWPATEPLVSLSSTFQLWKYNTSGWVALNTSPDTVGRTLSLSNHVPGSVYAVILNATCPAAITAPGSYSLSGNAAGEPNSAAEIAGGAMACVKIGASNVLFDCNGFSVAGDGSATTSYGIALNSSATNVTVQNCPSVQGYTTGVEASGVNGTILSNITSANNGQGFFLNSTGNNTFIFDVATNNSGSGFTITTGSNSVVSQSNSTNNNGYGFSITSGDNLYLPIDLASGNNGFGYSVTTGNNPNFAIDTASNNNGFGFAVIAGANANFAIDNASGNNGYGFSVVTGDNPNFAIDTAANNNGFGFAVVTGNNPNFAIDSATNNNGYGFSVVTGDFPNFAANSAVNSSSFGFAVTSGRNGTYDDNSAIGNNGYGFSIASGNGTTFTANNASSNAGNGFSLSPGSSSVFVSNFAQNNTGSGFRVSAAMSNTFTGDFAGTNGVEGFLLSGGNGNNITNLSSGRNTAAGLDISSANNTLVTGAHLYGNAPDFSVSGNGTLFNLSGVSFDSAGGAFANYTNLSVNDLVDSAYSISWSAEPPLLPSSTVSFARKFVNITGITPNASVDSLTLQWLQSEVTAGSFIESNFRIFYFNGSWTQQPPLPAGHTLSMANVSAPGVYGILAIPLVSSGGGPSGGGATPALTISYDPSTGTATVTSGGTPVPGADVKVDGSEIGTTDPSGKIQIPGCGQGATLDALKSGYTAASASVSLMSCAPACTSDQNCSASQACVSGMCVPVSCPNGTVTNHQCVVQNNTNQTKCVAPSCCTDSSQCGDTQACVSPSGAPATASSPGSCQEISGQCGVAAGHAFVPYNYSCGSEPGCPSCPSGQSCQDHKCVQNDISCPSSGIVGDNVTCKATQNSQACGPQDNCTATVTAPDGRQLSANPDENGNVLLPLALPGNYTVTLFKSGQAVKVLHVSAIPRSTPAEQNPPTAAGPDIFSMLWLLLLLLIVIGAVLYWRSRSRK